MRADADKAGRLVDEAAEQLQAVLIVLDERDTDGLGIVGRNGHRAGAASGNPGIFLGARAIQPKQSARELHEMPRR
jgi:hypothetical protein